MMQVPLFERELTSDVSPRSRLPPPDFTCIQQECTSGIDPGAEHGPSGNIQSRNMMQKLSSEDCCFCALKELFGEFQFSEVSARGPDRLRRALCKSNANGCLFHPGAMGDATEALEALLDALHVATGLEQGDIAGVRGNGRREESSGLSCSSACIAHEVFGIEYVDRVCCSFCGATGEPSVTSSYVYPVYVAELLPMLGQVVDEAPSGWEWGVHPLTSLVHSATPPTTPSAKRPLEKMMWDLCQRELSQKCAECNSLRTVSSERWLTHRPRTFVVSLVWSSPTPSRDSVAAVLSAVHPQISLEEVFRTDARSTCAPCHENFLLRGVVCYNSMHYIAIFWCWSRKAWILFDDGSVFIQRDWGTVVGFLNVQRYAPTLLFFEHERGTPQASIEAFCNQVTEFDRHGPCSLM